MICVYGLCDSECLSVVFETFAKTALIMVFVRGQVIDAIKVVDAKVK